MALMVLQDNVQSGVVFAVGGGGETRGTSHEAASNHLTRLEVNYGVQQIDMHKSFREKEKRATL